MTNQDENQGVPPVQGAGQTPQAQVIQPQPQATPQATPQNYLPIAIALLIGLIIIALVLAWGLSQIKGVPSPGPSPDEIVVNIVMPEQAGQGTTAQIEAVDGYHYRHKTTTAVGDDRQTGYNVVGPAIIKLDSYSLNPATTRMALLILNGESFTLPEPAVVWELTGRDDAILRGESPYWDGFFRLE